MRSFLPALTLTFALAVPVTCSAKVTVYRTDRTWVEGDTLERQLIFGDTYYFLHVGSKLVRFKKAEVAKIIWEEAEDRLERVKFHMEQGLKALQEGKQSQARAEFLKVLRITPDSQVAKDHLRQLANG